MIQNRGLNLVKKIINGKAVDDIFATKVNVSSLEEAFIIIDALRRNERFAIQTTKFSGGENCENNEIYDEYEKTAKLEGKTVYKKRKDGYEAVSIMVYDKTDLNCPVMEVLFRTFEMEYKCTKGPLAHDCYKAETDANDILNMISNGILPPLPIMAFEWSNGQDAAQRIKDIITMVRTFYPKVPKGDLEKACKAGTKMGSFNGYR